MDGFQLMNFYAEHNKHINVENRESSYEAGSTSDDEESGE